VTTKDTTLMPCPKWLQEVRNNDIEVKSWIDLAQLKDTNDDNSDNRNA